MNAAEAETILDFFTQFMPHFHITKENLLRPTPELVFRFYSDFIAEFQERASSVVGAPILLDADSDLEGQERVFRKMSQLSTLFESAGMKFVLADIYEPTVVRTKSMFKLCLHFLSYSEQIQDEIVKLGNDIYKMRSDTFSMNEEKKQLDMSINETAEKKAKLLESVACLTNELKSVIISQEEYAELRSDKEKANAEERKQIEILKRELQKENHESEMLELEERQLAEQTITDKEHKNLLKMLDNLENEIATLGHDDVDMADILLLENDTLEHYQACIKRLPAMSEFKIDLVKSLIDHEMQLNDLELNTEKLCNTKLSTLRNAKRHIEERLKEVEHNLLETMTKYESLRADLIKSLEELAAQVKKEKEEIDAKGVGIYKNISHFTARINKLESDKKKLGKHFYDEYTAFCEAEKLVIDQFSSHIKSLQKKLGRHVNSSC